MKIKMLDTVTDVHPFVVLIDDNRHVDVVFDQQTFAIGETYELPELRAIKLVAQGHAEKAGK